jgi:hypothetical protein
MRGTGSGSSCSRTVGRGTALLGSGLGKRFGINRVYLAGLVAGLLAMVLLIVSSFLTEAKTLVHGLLQLATASLGAGFGLTVPA